MNTLRTTISSWTPPTSFYYLSYDSKNEVGWHTLTPHQHHRSRLRSPSIYSKVHPQYTLRNTSVRGKVSVATTSLPLRRTDRSGKAQRLHLARRFRFPPGATQLDRRHSDPRRTRRPKSLRTPCHPSRPTGHDCLTTLRAAPHYVNPIVAEERVPARVPPRHEVRARKRKVHIYDYNESSHGRKGNKILRLLGAGPSPIFKHVENSAFFAGTRSSDPDVRSRWTCTTLGDEDTDRASASALTDSVSFPRKSKKKKGSILLWQIGWSIAVKNAN